MRFKVKIRRGLAKVKPEANQVDGCVFNFIEGWVMDAEDTSIYIGERAMIPRDNNYPITAPSWIASGDLEAIH